jgi:PAS domain S-box-containing protein
VCYGFFVSAGEIPAFGANLPGSLTGASSCSAHAVQFYREDRALISALGKYIGNSLKNGDPAIVIATEAHSEALCDELYDQGVDLTNAVKQGRYQSHDARETISHFMVDGMPDEAKFVRLMSSIIQRSQAASRRERPCVSIFGEMVALLWMEGEHAAAIRLEELWNNLAETHLIRLRCAYPMSSFAKHEHLEPFLKICAEHSQVIPEESYMAGSDDDEHLRYIASLQQKLESMETQEKLLETEQQLRLLVAAVQDYAIFMLDPEGRIRTWNAGAQRIKGYEASEIIGQHFSVFYADEDLKARKPQRELEVAVRDGRIEDEGWRVRKDGSRFWANVIITAVRNSNGELLGFGKVTRDFTERMLAQRALEESQRKLRDSETSLRQLSLHLLRTQDEERRRIGRDLHDSLGQYLSVLKMKLDSLVGKIDDRVPSEGEDLKKCAQLTADAVTEVRTISYLLYPPMLEEMGLRSAIAWYVDGFASCSGVKTAFEVSPHFPRISRDLELALFRVLQESLTNVHRHSGSPTATVRLSLRHSEVILEVSDCGKGVESRKLEEFGQDNMGSLGVGLRGMSERMRQLGGNLELSSTPKGTTVIARVHVPQIQESSLAQ